MKLPPEHVHGVGLKRATAYGGLGEKLLKQYGWKEGDGLGVQGTGITAAIKVLKKDGNIGIGGRQVVREAATSNWWQQSFDSALDKMGEAESESDSSDSDADEFDLQERRHNRDGTIASGTNAELKLERELAKGGWGRFGGRDGKLARIRAQEAALLAAREEKLDVQSKGLATEGRPKKRQKLEGSRQQKDSPQLGALPDAETEVKTTKQPEISEIAPLERLEDAKSSPVGKKKQKKKLLGEGNASKAKSKKASKVDRSQAVSIDLSKTEQRQKTERSRGSAAEAVKLKAEWWGASKFVAAGRLGGLSDEDADKSRNSFTEDTQEQLYMKTQAAKTAGKKGLGAGQGKAVGHEWKGKKTVFEDDEAEGQNAPWGIHSSNSEATCGDTSDQQEAHKEAGEKLSKKALSKLSWQILKQVTGKQLKLSKLAKRLQKQLPGHDSEIQHFLAQQVSACPKLAVEGKLVRISN